MDTQIVAIYCICDDILKGLQHGQDKQRQMSDAEVMTTSIVAALFFSGNMETSRVFLQEHGDVPKMLEKSRFHRRQHKIAELFLVVFELKPALFVLATVSTSSRQQLRLNNSFEFADYTMDAGRM